MRLSADPRDSHYMGKEGIGRYEVRLDGVVVEHAVTADTWTGEVHRYKTDEHGTFMRDRTGTDVEREVLRGKVEVFDKRTGKVVVVQPRRGEG